METFRQFVVRLQSYLQRWVAMAEIDKTNQGLLDLMVREQTLQICHKKLSLFLPERTPRSAGDMTRLAD